MTELTHWIGRLGSFFAQCENLASTKAASSKAEQAEDDLRFEKIDRKAYDGLGNQRRKGEDEYKRCFTLNAPKQPSFTEATRQAQELLSAALNKR